MSGLTVGWRRCLFAKTIVLIGGLWCLFVVTILLIGCLWCLFVVLAVLIGVYATHFMRMNVNKLLKGFLINDIQLNLLIKSCFKSERFRVKALKAYCFSHKYNYADNISKVSTNVEVEFLQTHEAGTLRICTSIKS